MEGLFSIWQNCKPTLANISSKWQTFIVVNGQNLKNNLAIWSHWRQVTSSVCLFIQGTMLQTFNASKTSVSLKRNFAQKKSSIRISCCKIWLLYLRKHIGRYCDVLKYILLDPTSQNWQSQKQYWDRIGRSKCPF